MSLKILLADDEKGHVDLIIRNLRRSGISNEIVHFDNGQSIIDHLKDIEKENNPLESYLVLLDIRMPKVDGFDVLKFIKSSEKLKSIPVIMVTTTDDPTEVQRCHELGCNNYVTKPIEYKEFVEAIKRLGLFIQIVKVPEMEK